MDLDICLTAFNISADEVNYRVGYRKAAYGGANIQSSRILFVNGAIDPFYATSVLQSPNLQVCQFLFQNSRAEVHVSMV